MRIAKWMLALIALLACGLIAVGCGDDDDDSSSSDEPATEESSSSDDTSSDTSSDSGVDADAFLSECQDAGQGAPGADEACQQAADALESCGEQAEAAGGDDAAVEAAIKICQDTADQAVEALQSAGG